MSGRMVESVQVERDERGVPRRVTLLDGDGAPLGELPCTAVEARFEVCSPGEVRFVLRGDRVQFVSTDEARL